MDNFEDFMKGKDLGDVLKKAENLKSNEKKMVYIARYKNYDGEEHVLRELKTKAEYDDWMERVGKNILKKDEELERGGRIEMDFGPSELNPMDAEITKVQTPEEAREEEKGKEAAKNLIDEILRKKGK